MEQNNKKKGVTIMLVTAVCFFLSFWYLGLDGQVIDFKNPPLVFKFIFASALLPLGLYAGLLFYGGKKIALQLGGGLGLLMALSYIFGFLLHH